MKTSAPAGDLPGCPRDLIAALGPARLPAPSIRTERSERLRVQGLLSLNPFSGAWLGPGVVAAEPAAAGGEQVGASQGEQVLRATGSRATSRTGSSAGAAGAIPTRRAAGRGASTSPEQLLRHRPWAASPPWGSRGSPTHGRAETQGPSRWLEVTRERSPGACQGQSQNLEQVLPLRPAARPGAPEQVLGRALGCTSRRAPGTAAGASSAPLARPPRIAKRSSCPRTWTSASSRQPIGCTR